MGLIIKEENKIDLRSAILELIRQALMAKIIEPNDVSDILYP